MRDSCREIGNVVACSAKLSRSGTNLSNLLNTGLFCYKRAMTHEEAVRKTAKFIKSKFEGEGTGHDWWHIYRVWQDSISIGEKENVNMFIVEMSALLHDLSDFKFNDEREGQGKIKSYLGELGLENETIAVIMEVVEDISFKGAGVHSKNRSKEAEVVQDADRLDAIGAMGVARAFAYGGKVGRPLYDPNIKPTVHKSFEDYRKHGNSSTINHFYEKLLFLKDQMNTRTGKEVARNRHEFMEQFLQRFYDEWDGKA